MQPINEENGEQWPFLLKLSEQQGMSPHRVSVLYALAAGNSGGDSFRAVQTVAACLRRRADPLDELGPVQQILRSAPWLTTRGRGDGSDVYCVLPINARTKQRNDDEAGPYDLQVWEWGDITAGTPVRWRHDGPVVGKVVANQRKSYGDMEVWIKLTDPATIERAAYNELDVSPTIRSGSRGTFSYNPVIDARTQEIWQGEVSELALVPAGTSALRIRVELRTAPTEQPAAVPVHTHVSPIPVRTETITNLGPMYLR